GTPDLVQVENDLRWMLRLDDDLSEFYELCRRESRLQHVPGEKGGRLIRSVSIWEDVVKVITTTNTAWSGTRRMCQNLVEHWGNGAFPAAKALAGVKIEMLKEKGGLGYRAPYIHELAQAVADGTLDLEALKRNSLQTDELYKFLRSLKGVGDYAASSILMLLGTYSRVPVDSIAHSLVSKLFYNGEPVTPAQIRACFADYGNFAGLAYWCWMIEE
ncbi:MAG TPA: hypothetical protein VJZ27_04560, partial [Aggregatilineales bacterium]|nr:hypothetical protein [Aggregatilineales bacterium]